MAFSQVNRYNRKVGKLTADKKQHAISNAVSPRNKGNGKKPALSSSMKSPRRQNGRHGSLAGQNLLALAAGSYGTVGDGD